jgi:L-alanine-DL-glutamate epimerase-like enolase superfamily enzyme
VDPIVDVGAVTTRIDLPRPITLGSMHIAYRAYTVVTVRTESGIEGNAFSLSRDAPIAEVVNRQLAPALEGKDSDAIAARWDDGFRATIAAGRVGVVMRALSLVDVALWDAKGQRAGLPLWRLLGGHGSRVPCLMVGGYPTADAPEELGAKVAANGRAGWRLLKIARGGDPGAMRRILATALAELPADCELVIDCAWFWRRPEQALRELDAWGDPPLAWLEDPFPAEDVHAYAALRDAGVPLGTGDELTDRHLLNRHLAEESIDVVRVDATTIGGISGALRVLGAAADSGLPVSCHVYPELHVHLAAAFGDGISVETFDPEDNPFDPASLLYRGGPELTAGFAVAAETAGLGIELDRERVEAGRVD